MEPPKKAIGTNTADSTSAMPTSAPLICPIALRVASRAGSPSSRITRSTFSTTTIASSTSRPIASTIANIVSVLMPKPKAASTAKVPSSTTGTASVGISVARKFCRNSSITRKTSPIASSSVITTPWMDSFTTGVVSCGIATCRPGGKCASSSARCARTAAAVSSALAPDCCMMPRPAAGLPLKRLRRL